MRSASVCVLVVLVWHSLRFDFVTDDAFISFVYAKNLVEHGALVFNLDERVEGYTNFLWTLILALGMRLGVAPELSSRGLGTLCAAVTLAAAGRCFLVADLSGMAGLDPVARRRIAEWSRGEDDKVDAVAVHGCSFAMRTLITLTLNAIKLLGRQRSETVFVRDEAAALRWLDAQRAAGAGSGRARGPGAGRCELAAPSGSSRWRAGHHEAI